MIGDYEVVDLGLPSGLLWATWNVGATKETEYGNYYQWGAGAATYKNKKQYYTHNTDLPSSADTATQVMGEGWRMPTRTELEELMNNTTYKWTTINGIKGGKHTSKTNPNAYVFFPAAGSYLDGNLGSVGDYVHVYSSSQYTKYTAYSLINSGMGDRYVTDHQRQYGLSVRGVYSPS